MSNIFSHFRIFGIMRTRHILPVIKVTCVCVCLLVCLPDCDDIGELREYSYQLAYHEFFLFVDITTLRNWSVLRHEHFWETRSQGLVPRRIPDVTCASLYLSLMRSLELGNCPSKLQEAIWWPFGNGPSFLLCW